MLYGTTFQHMADRHGSRFFRFALVGTSGILVRTSVLWLLVSLLGGHFLTAAIISSEVSILTNFALNDYWTFGDVRAEISFPRRIAHYHVVTLSGMVASIAVFAILTDLGIHYLLANLVSIGASTVSNYTLSMRFTWQFRVRRPDHPLVPVPKVAAGE